MSTEKIQEIHSAFGAEKGISANRSIANAANTFNNLCIYLEDCRKKLPCCSNEQNNVFCVQGLANKAERLGARRRQLEGKGRGVRGRLIVDTKQDSQKKRKRPHTQPWGTSSSGTSFRNDDLLDTRAKHAADFQDADNTEAGNPATRQTRSRNPTVFLFVTFFKKLGSPF